MKKIIAASALALLSLGVFAQEEATSSSNSSKDVLTNKNGMAILPAAGDIAFGVNAIPYLEYLGNLANGTSSNSLNLDKKEIYLRYYLTDNSAVRFNFHIDNSIDKDNTFVDDLKAQFEDPLCQDKVQNKVTTWNRDLGFNLGYMLTRGYGRLQGFYGAQIGYSYERVRQEWQYGNELSEVNQVAERDLELDNRITNKASVGLILGVEYFFLPKISIGGEANLSYCHEWKTEGNKKVEGWYNGGVVERDIESEAPDYKNSIKTTRPDSEAKLYLMFHF